MRRLRHHYAAAFGLAAIAVALQWVLHAWIGNGVPFLFVTPAVVVAAAIFGRGPALLVTAAGAINGMLLYPPIGSLRIDSASDVIALGVFLTLSAIIIIYASRVRVITANAALSDARLQRVQADLELEITDMRRVHALSQELVAAGDDLAACMHSVLALSLDFIGARHGTLRWRGRVSTESPAMVHRGLGSNAAEALGSMPLERGAGARCAGFTTVHSTPMLSSTGETIGVIMALFPEPHELAEREIRLCEVCASMAASKVERALSRQAASVEAQRFAVALESASVPFNIMAPVRSECGQLIDFRFSYINSAAARFLGFDASDLNDRRITEVLPRFWDRPGLLERFAAVVERGQAAEFEIPASVHNPGRWFHIIASPLPDSVAVWFTDISERKREEGLREEADRRKDEFLATLAHELRNPLAPIRQSIRIASAPTATEAQRRWSHDVIERQVKNMALLLDDLLDVSRISRGTLLLRKRRVELRAVVEEAVEVARPHIDAKAHCFDMQLPAEPLHLEVDPLRIAQVIGNLLTNAAKYTDHGGRIALRASVEDGELLIRVTDSGIGFTQVQMGHLFEMFAQVPSAIGRSQGGLGIGLALARSLVRLHGGEIAAISAGPGCGSEFVVRLPAATLVARCESDAASAAVSPAALRRILIADDNADAADSLAELLRIDGHEVHVAYDGQEALAYFSRYAPDAVLLDVGMPKLSGLDVARAIRRLPLGKQATLIAITGWGQSRDRVDAIEAGFDYHATKPIDPDYIVGLITSAGAAQANQPVAGPQRVPER